MTAACTNVCSRTLGDVDAGTTDAGVAAIPCQTTDDCPDETYSCAGGACLRECGADAACPDDGTFCGPQGYCLPGCRDSTTCGDNQVCLDGLCQTRTSDCSTRCDCEPGQVCADGSCADPPQTCTTSSDCPRGPRSPVDRCEVYKCDSFGHTCFDTDPQPCASATDCEGRLGCIDQSCVCSASQSCVPELACTDGDELQTCGAGNFCRGGTCDVLPGCDDEADCSSVSAGLICNIGRAVCERPRACTAGCLAPADFCDTTTQRCALPSCHNGGLTCDPGTETCAADGHCIPRGSGDACTGDGDCGSGQYCARVDATSSVCAIGCRSSTDCQPGQACNGAHACGPAGAGQFGDACVNGTTGQPDDALCQVGMVCGTISRTCAERCPTPSSDCAGGACCPLSGQECCNSFGFCKSGGLLGC